MKHRQKLFLMAGALFGVTLLSNFTSMITQTRAAEDTKPNSQASSPQHILPKNQITFLL